MFWGCPQDLGIYTQHFNPPPDQVGDFFLEQRTLGWQEGMQGVTPAQGGSSGCCVNHRRGHGFSPRQWQWPAGHGSGVVTLWTPGRESSGNELLEPHQLDGGLGRQQRP